MRHGAFTQALLDGLSGQATDAEGFITVLALATHASRLVPQMTEGKQRPYIAFVGEDLVLAGDPARLSQLHPRALPAEEAPAAPTARARVAIRSFEHLGPDTTYDWMRKALSQDIVTAFTEVGQLQVYDESMLRFVTRDAPDVIDAAQRAGISMLVEGAYWVQDNQLSVSAQVKSVRPLELVASARAQGPVDQFSLLTSQLVRGLLDKLPVQVPSTLAARLQQQTGPSLAARRLMAESDSASSSTGEVPRGAPRSGIVPGASPWPSMIGRAFDLLARVPLLARRAWAAAAMDPEGELHATLEGYRRALEGKDLNALRGYYEEFTESQNAALVQYFASADDLHIEFSNVLVAIIADNAAVSFTRDDRFVDRSLGVPQHVTVRVTKRFARQANGWVIQREP
jgi:TolB-like protein